MEDTMKYYQLGVKSEADWDVLHQLLTSSTPEENSVPTREVECTDEMLWTATSSVYRLTDEEAAMLKNHPSISYIHLDPASYPELHKTIKVNYI
jgi:hypothetical protein